ncbi:MAG: hypothetical protein ACT4N8_02090, partial [Sphingosinicella sp.]
MSDDRASVAPADPAKVDPETLVLRGSPGRVVRFRRGVIVAIAALGLIAIIATAWLALRPAALGLVALCAPRVLAGPLARHFEREVTVAPADPRRCGAIVQLAAQ